MSRIVDGDTEALGAVFDRHGGPAYSLARRILKRATDAEDVTQEVFVSIWRKAIRFDPERGSLRSWILTIVRNRAIDELRRNGSRPALDGDDGAVLEESWGGTSVHQQVVVLETQEELQVALDELPREQHQVVDLAYFAGLTHRQIAARLGIPEGTVKGRMRLAFEKLRPALTSTAAEPTARTMQHD